MDPATRSAVTDALNATDLMALLPLIFVAATVLVVMLVIAFYRSHEVTIGLTLAGLTVALAALPQAADLAPRAVTPLLVIDAFGILFMGLLLLATFAVALLSYDYLELRGGRTPEEYYVLLLLAGLGGLVLAVSSHFASFFLGLEILSVSLYALIAYMREEARGLEAGLKYLVLGATSASILLFGIALIYAETGTLEFAGVAQRLAAAGPAFPAVVLAGFALLVVGIGFKLALVPFHLWTPDVYEGAPAPVTAFVATTSKGAMVALLLRYFYQTGALENSGVYWTFAAIAVASMFFGNLLALLQTNVKRILAYSSIAHLGYLLVAFLAGGAVAASSVIFYLVTYFITILCAFGVVSLLSGAERDADRMTDYNGLAQRRPLLAAALTASLFSLAGIPLTAGFMGKYFVLATGIGSALWLLVVVLVINSAIGMFYYLRVVTAIYWPAGRAAEAGEVGPAGAGGEALASAAILTVLVISLVWVGVYPGPLMALIEGAVTGGRLSAEGALQTP